MKIHRVFIDIGLGKEQKFFTLYCEEKIKQYCIKNNHDYFFWNDEKVEKLLNKYPQYKKLYYGFKYGIMRVDFIRFLILYEEGGLYIDCDIIININNIDIKNNIGFCYNGKDIDNSIIYSIPKNKFILIFFESIYKNIIEKNNKQIYNTWKGRYVLQTVGKHAIKRVLKSSKTIYNLYKVTDNGFLNKKEKNLTKEIIENILIEEKNTDYIRLPSFTWIGIKPTKGRSMTVPSKINNYSIAILSYDRIKVFEKKTYKLLKKYNLIDKSILFLSTEKDIDEYSKFNIPSVLSPKGYCETCNFISDYFPLGKKIIIMGDDISRFNEFDYNCGKNLEVKNLDDLFNTLFNKLEEKNISLGGFYPTSNPLALKGLKNLITTDLRFIHDATCGMINRGIKLDPDILKCDFQRTILYYERDKGIVRLNNYSFDTRFNKGKGGNTEEKTNEAHYSKIFEEKYKEYIQRKITHKSGTSSFILRKNGKLIK